MGDPDPGSIAGTAPGRRPAGSREGASTPRLRRPWLAGLLLAAAACGPPGAGPPDGPLASWIYAGPPAVATGAQAMVASDAPLATEVGIDILRAGGNAVDAAVATAFALAVVYPEAGNLGGGGFLVARLADGTAAALDFRELAPAAASRDMYLDSAGNVTDRSRAGHLASGVPGAVAGLRAAHDRFGTLPWPSLLEPAIRLARAGFTVDSALSASVRAARAWLEPWPASARLFLPDGQPLAQGDTWRNPDLALVLERIAAGGAAGFYEGETADLIVAEMRRGGGLITHEDLRAYRPAWRDPVAFEYRGHTVLSMPPSSSGGITLGLLAGLLEGYDLEAAGWHSPAVLHLMAEAMRRAFADRNAFLGDPDFVSIPARLTSRPYIDSLRATIRADRATPSADVIPGLGARPEPAHTTHFSIVDPAGNAVALTTTINELYGSGVTVAGAGFLLNDEMDDFTARAGVPNMFGLIQGEANAIAPGKRMLSAMTPTIVLDSAGAPLLVTGARGGPRIITAVFQVISNVIDYGMDAGAAVHAPRIHHQHLPDTLAFEATGLDSATINGLRSLGHAVQSRSGYVGSAPSILRRNGIWYGVPDPRTGGLARGF
jgi:gamma-glutamyltranspeptidase/glutathione hydrolase